MGDTTAIEWATATWNPWWGCRKVSPGCANCYAETLANRFHDGLWRGQHRLVKDWGGPGRVDRKAAREGRRARLFVASMADVFEDHPDLVKWRGSALHLLAGLKHTDVLLLTKRPENVARMVPPWWTDPNGFVPADFDQPYARGWPAHIWLGTTVEDQQRADERIPHLLRVPAPVRFLSVEPLLGPVDLTELPARWDDGDRPLMRLDGLRGGYWVTRTPLMRRWVDFGPETQGEGGPPTARIAWVIAGGESGPRARPMAPEWARSVRDQCAAAGVPFFFKQWGGRDKKAAGRLLDSREHSELPERA